MSDDKLKTFISRLKTLPEYEGVSDDEIIADLKKFPQASNEQKENFAESLSSLDEYRGHETQDILKDVDLGIKSYVLQERPYKAGEDITSKEGALGYLKRIVTGTPPKEQKPLPQEVYDEKGNKLAVVPKEAVTQVVYPPQEVVGKAPTLEQFLSNLPQAPPVSAGGEFGAYQHELAKARQQETEAIAKIPVLGQVIFGGAQALHDIYKGSTKFLTAVTRHPLGFVARALPFAPSSLTEDKTGVVTEQARQAGEGLVEHAKGITESVMNSFAAQYPVATLALQGFSKAVESGTEKGSAAQQILTFPFQPITATVNPKNKLTKDLSAIGDAMASIFVLGLAHRTLKRANVITGEGLKAVGLTPEGTGETVIGYTQDGRPVTATTFTKTVSDRVGDFTRRMTKEEAPLTEADWEIWREGLRIAREQKLAAEETLKQYEDFGERLKNPQTALPPHGRKAVWTTKDTDIPVTVTGEAGEYGGQKYYRIAESMTAIPESEVNFIKTPEEMSQAFKNAAKIATDYGFRGLSLQLHRAAKSGKTELSTSLRTSLENMVKEKGLRLDERMALYNELGIGVKPEPEKATKISDLFPGYEKHQAEYSKEDYPIQFNDSGAAIEFGKKATQEQVDQMNELLSKVKAESQEVLAAGNEQRANELSSLGMFYREAIEESGKTPKPAAETFVPGNPDAVQAVRIVEGMFEKAQERNEPIPMSKLMTVENAQLIMGKEGEFRNTQAARDFEELVKKIVQHNEQFVTEAPPATAEEGGETGKPREPSVVERATQESVDEHAQRLFGKKFDDLSLEELVKLGEDSNKALDARAQRMFGKSFKDLTNNELAKFGEETPEASPLAPKVEQSVKSAGEEAPLPPRQIPVAGEENLAGLLIDQLRAENVDPVQAVKNYLEKKGIKPTKSNIKQSFDDLYSALQARDPDALDVIAELKKPATKAKVAEPATKAKVATETKVETAPTTKKVGGKAVLEIPEVGTSEYMNYWKSLNAPQQRAELARRGLIDTKGESTGGKIQSLIGIGTTAYQIAQAIEDKDKREQTLLQAAIVLGALSPRLRRRITPAGRLLVEAVETEAMAKNIQDPGYLRTLIYGEIGRRSLAGDTFGRGELRQILNEVPYKLIDQVKASPPANVAPVTAYTPKPTIQEKEMQGSFEGQLKSDVMKKLAETAINTAKAEAGSAESGARFKASFSPEELRTFERLSVMIQNYPEMINELDPVMKEAGIDPIKWATWVKQSASEAGRFMGYLSYLEREMAKIYKDNPGVREIIGDSFPDQPWYRKVFSGSAWLDAFRKVEAVRRASMVTQFSTTLRNIETQGLRSMIEVADNFIQSKFLGEEGGVERASEQMHVSLKNYASIMKDEKGIKTLDDILAKYPIEKKYLFSSPVHEVAAVNQYIRTINTFNRLQENFFRRMNFQVHLSNELSKRGISVRDLTDTREVERLVDKADLRDMVEKSVMASLENTFSAPATSDVTRAMLKLWHEFPLLTLVNPFPRFNFANALKFLYEFSPFGLTKILSKDTLSRTAEGDAKAYSRALIGTSFLATALMARLSDNAGQNWYDLKIGGQNVDTRAFSPFSAYLFGAEVMIQGLKAAGFDMRDYLNKNYGFDYAQPKPIELADYALAILGMNRVGGTALVFSDLIKRGSSSEEQSKTAKDFLGQWFSGFSVPARLIKEPVTIFSPEEGKPRSTREEPVTAPFISNVPFASQTLPYRYSPFQKGEFKNEPVNILGFLHLPQSVVRMFGFSVREARQLEEEVNKIGIIPNEIFPRTGIPEADRIITQAMGENLKGSIDFIRQKEYIKAEEPLKRIMLKEWFKQLRQVGLMKLYQTNPGLYKELWLKKQNEDILELFKMREPEKAQEVGVE